MTGLRTSLFSMLVLSTACSTDFTPQPCGLDSDCATEMVCEQRSAQAVCVPATDAPLIIGESAPVSGANQALGTAMKLGIKLAFDDKNAAGGIRGRQLQLDFRDDSYDPDLAATNTKNLVNMQTMTGLTPKCPSTSMTLAGNMGPVATSELDRGPNAVLAILGSVGTATTVRAAPIALETGTVYFGAFTGASTLLRDSTAGACAKYIFNVRASYAQEATATVEYFKSKGVTNYKNFISFDQQDSFGQAGYDGLKMAYLTKIGSFPTNLPDPTTPIARFRYVRNDDSSVPLQVTLTETNALKQILLADMTSPVITVGIMMTDTYGAATTYIQMLRTWQWDGATDSDNIPPASKQRLRMIFSNVSFVGPNQLAINLHNLPRVPGAVANPTTGDDGTFTSNVVVSQVVPNYQSDSSDVVTSYNNLIAHANPPATPTFTSLEGYVAARVFIAGLEAHKGPFTADSLVTAFESLPDLGLGIGATSGFSKTNHQYSTSVWGTSLLPDGSFKNLYFWTDGSPIMFPE